MIPTSFLGFADPVSCLTHLGAAVFFLFSGIFLLKRVKSKLQFYCLATFVSSCVFLLSMSGTYHLLPRGGYGRLVLQHLDHAAIFMLIAGTFTAVHGVLYTGGHRYLWLIAVWALTAVGITLKMVFFKDIPEGLGLAIYLGLGWAGVLWGVTLWRKFGFSYIKPLVLGGIAYTFGAVLEYFREPILIQGVIGPHELFHVAVLVGIAFHWYFVSSSLDLHSGEGTHKEIVTEFQE